MAVTVDDLPRHGPDVRGSSRIAIARQLLAAFHKHGVPQVYGFVNGKWLEDDPSLRAVLDEWRAAGYPLGNHAFSHPNLNRTDLAAYFADVERNEAVLAQWGPPSMWKAFRYPFLFEGADAARRIATRAWLQEHGYRIAQVTIDFDDYAWNPPFARCTERNDAAALAELRRTWLDAAVRALVDYREMGRLLEGREVKHVLLLHAGAMDADQIDPLLTSYEVQGVRWVTLEEAQRDPLYAKDRDPGWTTKWGFTLLDQWIAARGLHPAPRVRTDLDRVQSLCR